MEMEGERREFGGMGQVLGMRHGVVRDKIIPWPSLQVCPLGDREEGFWGVCG